MSEYAESSVNPFSRFGFERLFGLHQNSAPLIDFLHQLPGLAPVERISFISPADLFEEPGSGDAVFDLFCQDALGIPIKIQVQLLLSDQWWEKSLAYAYTSDYHEYVANAAPYPTYCLGILISDQCDCPLKFIEDSYLWRFDCTFEMFGMPDARFHFIYLEPNRYFASLPEPAEGSRLHQWLYVLANLPLLSVNAPMASDPLFYSFIQSASLSNLCAEEREAYNRSLENFWQ